MPKNGPGDWQWGWRMLMHDLRNPEKPEPVTQQQPIQQPNALPQNISNIVNYPPSKGVPMQLKRFHFASILTIIVTVTLLIIAGLLLWKTGALTYLVQMFHNLVLK